MFRDCSSVRVVSTDEFLRRIQDRLARAQVSAAALYELQREKSRRALDLLSVIESEIYQVKNQSESDVDCGGICGKCVAGKACGAPADCIDGVCTGGVCQAAACNDSVKNGSETDTDCGGSCVGCATGKVCEMPETKARRREGVRREGVRHG